MAVSKRLRHEIFRRDNHTCQSCGAKAPGVKLEPDHVIPVALGGSDEPSNLQTLCASCNSGKSATPPDASTVAQVSADAVRWSRAMQAAAADMIGNLKARETNREYFKQCWHRWHWGTDEAPEYALLPAAWETSIDQILAAGLPVELLKDCVDTAFAYEKVKRENKFKYACGVAWRKIDKLQEVAQRNVTGEASLQPVAAAGSRSERNALVVKLMNRLTIEERMRNSIDPVLVYEGMPDEDGEDPLVGAVEMVLVDLRSDLMMLEDVALDLLAELPHGAGAQAMEILRFQLYDVDFETEDLDDLPDRSTFVRRSTAMAGHLLKVHEASAYLDGLLDEERAEWLDYAHSVNGLDGGWKLKFTPDLAIIRAAYAAKVITSGDGWWPRMCLMPGKHIQACPHPAEFLVLLDGVKCCGPGGPEGHTGHPYCAEHTEALVADGVQLANGTTYTVRDFAAIEPEPAEEPPF